VSISAASDDPADAAASASHRRWVVPDPIPDPEPLNEPAGGIPEVVDTPKGVEAAGERLSAGHGPVAVDVERASGYRYGQRAFLIQLHRADTGTLLIDPVPLTAPEAATGLSGLVEVLASTEWVLHAANQDLPSLAELGLHPRTLFDTELAARLAGYPRVGLGPLVEHVLGYRLAKEHSAVDWSTRPLPDSWLRYAALDVEVLLPLRAAMERELARQGKLEWARQEFAAIAAAPPAPPKVDPWRRTSGLHQVRKRRQLAAVRELWIARDNLARTLDVSPGRLLPDSAIVAAAQALPPDAAALAALPGFTGRAAHRHLSTWMRAISRARRLPERDLPPLSRPVESPPPARTWSRHAPDAAARLSALRAALGQVAETHAVPAEHLLAPDTVRRLAWAPPSPDEQAVRTFLTSHGARPWQIDLTAALLARTLTDRAAES
jgi:ribonuclease D